MSTRYHRYINCKSCFAPDEKRNTAAMDCRWNWLLEAKPWKDSAICQVSCICRAWQIVSRSLSTSLTWTTGGMCIYKEINWFIFWIFYGIWTATRNCLLCGREKDRIQRNKDKSVRTRLCDNQEQNWKKQNPILTET